MEHGFLKDFFLNNGAIFAKIEAKETLIRCTGAKKMLQCKRFRVELSRIVCDMFLELENFTYYYVIQVR